MLRPHRLFVIAYGTPAPQGSKRHVGRGILIDHNPESLRTWREDVKFAALTALADSPQWERDYPAVLGDFVFTMARPKAHYGSGVNANRVRPTAPRLHATRPDLDKLLRSTWDALTTAGVYADDSRLTQVQAAKRYTTVATPTYMAGTLDRPGVWIMLTGVGQ